MAIKVISSHEAVVKTAAVEIRSLTISGRQVTLAVFRQLEEEALVDPETIEFRGLPWGRINYHPDKCTDAGWHLHVVWQKGSELRRATHFPSEFRHFDQWGKTQRAIPEIRSLCQFYRWTVEEPTVQTVSFVTGKTVEQPIGMFSYLGHEVTLLLPNGMPLVLSGNLAKVIHLHWRKEREPHEEREYVPLWQRYQNTSAVYRAHSYTEACSRMADYEKRAQAIQDAWKCRWGELESLDQLFIAV